jgi:hypothetical protein
MYVLFVIVAAIGVTLAASAAIAALVHTMGEHGTQKRR